MDGLIPETQLANTSTPAQTDENFQLEGQVHEQYVRCGKAACRCVDGDLHGPYYYRIWRDGARVRKVYVRIEEIDQIKAACATHKIYMDQLRQHRQMRRELQRVIKQSWRTAKSLVRIG